MVSKRSWEMYESITKTLEILADQELMTALRQSVQEIASEETYDWETVKAELGV